MRQNLTLREAISSDFDAIIEIANKTWPATYGEILGVSQLEFMLALFYTNKALEKNRSEGQDFLIVFEEEQAVAFASYQNNYSKKTTHIHKIYVLPRMHKRGIGALLMAEIEKRAIDFGANFLSLNVNRFNNAKNFYTKIGFEIEREVDIEIGNGYLMEDYIMKKNLTN